MRADPRYKTLPAEPATLLNEGRVHEAVKALRESHNLGAREARRWIDSYINDDPMLRVQLETQRRSRRRRYFFWFLVIDILLTAGIIYYLFYMPR
jgi:hypothetical protein